MKNITRKALIVLIFIVIAIYCAFAFSWQTNKITEYHLRGIREQRTAERRQMKRTVDSLCFVVRDLKAQMDSITEAE